ncbi:MAG: hypothetical protein RL367_968 [Pseudomonadota bacterium]
MDRALVAERIKGAGWRSLQTGFLSLAIGLIGPAAIAGTQFAAAMLLWHAVSPGEFGLFSFAILLVQLSFGLSNALFGTPLSVALRGPGWSAVHHGCLSIHGLFLGLIGLAVPLALWLTGGSANLAGFALLAVTANLRWAARSCAIAREKVAISARADCAYAAIALGLLGLAMVCGRLSLGPVIYSLVAANVAVTLVFNREFLGRQFAALLHPDFKLYAHDIWPNQVRWSLAGVLTTEASGNAHGYLVTGFAGAASFAPLAFASLFCRPMTIFLGAITQTDRPVFARLIGEKDAARLTALLQRSYVSAGLIWLGNAIMAALALQLFSPQIAARGYDMDVVRTAIISWFAITALRGARNPLATLLQARGAFRLLAVCSLGSALVSVAAVGWFVAIDPAHSLVGIVAGELVLMLGILLASRTLAR